jgi:two-component system LytT family response regulator
MNNFAHLVIEESETVSDARQKIGNFEPHLVFLDVQMRGETGFDLLNQLSTVPAGIIFITAHSEFAVKAFRYSAMDYLMKPLDPEEFRIAVMHALEKIKLPDANAAAQINFLKTIKNDHQLPDKLTIPTAEGFLFVNIADLIYCMALGNYTEFHLTGNQKLLSSHTLGYYNDLLAHHHFFRIHRSFLINLSHLKMYKKGDGGMVVMDNGMEIEISRTNKEAFLKMVKV